jgi:hypothetical protein
MTVYFFGNVRGIGTLTATLTRKKMWSYACIFSVDLLGWIFSDPKLVFSSSLGLGMGICAVVVLACLRALPFGTKMISKRGNHACIFSVDHLGWMMFEERKFAFSAALALGVVICAVVVLAHLTAPALPLLLMLLMVWKSFFRFWMSWYLPWFCEAVVLAHLTAPPLLLMVSRILKVFWSF